MKKDEFKHFIGIDISKNTLDLAYLNVSSREEFKSLQVSNDTRGMKQICNFIKDLNLKFENILFCMEHTGIYGLQVQKFLVHKEAFVWVEMAYRIIKSSGLKRGKNDEVDAKRIAQYACRYQDDRQQWVPDSEQHEKITDLLNLRERLISAKNMFLVPVKELGSTNECHRSKKMLKSCQSTLRSLETDLFKVEKELETLVKSDNDIKKNVELATSIPGIGKWTALAFILATNNFKRKMTSRQLACFCGCAPFEHRSGTSVRGKTRVSHMANKNLKKLLTLCARSILRSKNELAEYYNRKLAEGKNKMSIINALRNKLIQRICAVIERQTPYVPAN